MGVGGERHSLAALLPRMPRYPSYRRLGELQGRCGRMRKICPPPTGFDPCTVQPVASLYRMSYLFYTLHFYVYLHLTSFLISLVRAGARAHHPEII
jgi:hypothetical protein